MLANRGYAPHSPEVLAKTFTPSGERKYCTYPFRLIGIGSDYLKNCTWLKASSECCIPLGKLIKENEGYLSNAIKNAWTSDTFNDVRAAIADGSYLYCDMQNCPEYHGKQEFFFTLPELEEKYPQIASFVKGDTDKYDGFPETMNVAYDPRCNLSCPSCNRHILPKFSEEIEKEFSAGIRLVGQNIKNLFLVGMGDPFGTTHYLEFLRNLDPTDYPSLKEIIFNTNAMKLTPEIWYSIPEGVRKFVGTMVVSMDGASKTSFETNRFPAKWDDFLERLKFISELRKTNQIKSVTLYYVYQLNNYKEMPRAVKIAKDHGIDCIFFARIRDWGTLGEKKIRAVDVNRPDHPQNRVFEYIKQTIRATMTGTPEIVIME